ncbi:MAG TPA: hypothetical protein VI322_02900, partial [Candidatus Saccharimonadia bacterium]
SRNMKCAKYRPANHPSNSSPAKSNAYKNMRVGNETNDGDDGEFFVIVVLMLPYQARERHHIGKCSRAIESTHHLL